MMPIGLLIPCSWQNAFLRTASSPPAENSRRTKAGIPQGGVADCFRCAVKTWGLKNVNAEADFFFIEGYLGFLLVAWFILPKTGLFL
jgi:hypothetical protein